MFRGTSYKHHLWASDGKIHYKRVNIICNTLYAVLLEKWVQEWKKKKAEAKEKRGKGRGKEKKKNTKNYVRRKIEHRKEIIK